MEKMITTARAHILIQEQLRALASVELPVSAAFGLTIADDIISQLNIPGYPQSSMDGYAFAYEKDRDNYEVMGEMAAGSDRQFTLPKGKAVRIFTGAAVPEGADTVLMQEKAVVENGILQFADHLINPGDNVRPVGSEIAKGELALSAGHRLNAASIGFLTGMGIDVVRVFPRPRVAILVTGNELQEIGKPLGYGQVYDSNSWTLSAALEQLSIREVKIWKSGDDPNNLTSTLQQALQYADIVLMTGGVSVGDYDFTLQAFADCGVERVFHKIRQKPGKPILFGTKDNKPVFGLPGNPASVLTCFYQYVLPALSILMQQELRLKKIFAPLAHDHAKPAGLTHFLKAVYNGSGVSLQRGQESYKLSSFATANCLVVLPEEKTEVSKGERVEVHLFP